jgi:hypothetical protein
LDLNFKLKMSSTKLHPREDEFESKKKRLHSRPQVDAEDEVVAGTASKMKTENKSASKIKVTPSKAEFQRNAEITEQVTTPMKSPNKTGLKSVQGRQKTPYNSKMKGPSDVENGSDESVIKETTPVKLPTSAKKGKTAEKVRSTSKSPLGRIDEARNESDKKAKIEEAPLVDVTEPENVPVINEPVNVTSEEVPLNTETIPPTETEHLPETITMNEIPETTATEENIAATETVLEENIPVSEEKVSPITETSPEENVPATENENEETNPPAEEKVDN